MPSIPTAEDFSTSGMSQPPLLLDSPEVIASVFLESVPVCASWPLQLLCLLVSDHLKERKTPQYPGVPDQKPTDLSVCVISGTGLGGCFPEVPLGADAARVPSELCLEYSCFRVPCVLPLVRVFLFSPSV